MKNEWSISDEKSKLNCQIISNEGVNVFNLFIRFIEPTILVDPPLDAEIMTEEIFGPLLPIITVSLRRLCFSKLHA